jgi:hypothetical protein
MTSKDRQPIQQLVITLMPTTIQVTTNLPTYVPRHSDHQPPNGGQPKNWFGGSSPEGNPLGERPFNPLVASFKWLALNLCMFIPPWYQPPIVQLVSELATKLPYKKLQYPTYVKNIDPCGHIRVFKKAIKTNGETLEADINLFIFTFRDSIFEWGENYVQDHPN